MSRSVILRVDGLRKSYGRDGHRSVAVEDVSFEVRRGQTFGLVGESGSGKSSIARAVLRLHEIDSGQIYFDGSDLYAMDRHELRAFRRSAQMVFQDPYNSLNRRKRVGDIVGGRIHESDRARRNTRVIELLEMVGLDASHVRRFPRELSGGQCQRVAIARALAPRPSLLVLDEAVSALDVSVRAQVLNLLVELQSSLDLSYLFISHDLGVVKYLCDHVAVLFAGRVVEAGPTQRLMSDPLHPYTQDLMAAVPRPEVRRSRPDGLELTIGVEVERPPREGCAYHLRCALATGSELCRTVRPEPRGGASHRVACHLADTSAEEGARAQS